MTYACLHNFLILRALCVSEVPEKAKPVLNHLRIAHSARSFLITISQFPQHPISQEGQVD